MSIYIHKWAMYACFLTVKRKNYWTDFYKFFYYELDKSFQMVRIRISELGQRTNWHSEFVIELQAGISGSPQHCLKAVSWLIYFSQCCAGLGVFLLTMVVLLIISLIISSASGNLFVPNIYK